MKKVKDEEKVIKKSTSKKVDGKKEKTVEKKADKKVQKTDKPKVDKSANKVFGKYNPTSAKGKVAAQAAKAGKISEKEAKGLAKGKDASRILYRIRRFGKKSGLFSLFPSKKTEGTWIFKAKGKLPGLKVAA